MEARNIDMTIDQFVPKYEIRQRIGLVADFIFIFLLFSVDSIKKIG